MSGYCACECRDCMEIAMTNDDGTPTLCSECEEAGCDAAGESECEAAGAYGLDDGEEN